MLLILLRSDAGQFVIIYWFRGQEEGRYFTSFFYYVVLVLMCFCFFNCVSCGWFTLSKYLLNARSGKKLNQKTDTKWKTRANTINSNIPFDVPHSWITQVSPKMV